VFVLEPTLWTHIGLPLHFLPVLHIIVNPSGLLFHILSIAIVSLGMPALSLSSSASVMGHPAYRLLHNLQYLCSHVQGAQ
jgi:hypothetical protein